jgi:hypothetical protein
VSGTLPVSNGGTGLTGPGSIGNVLTSTGGGWTSSALNTLVPTASETVSGIAELATSAEAQAGTDTTRTITPASMRGGLNAVGSAPVFACRAWVNYNGSTGAIRASGNVASMVQNSVGDYTITFTTPMPDANYVVVGTCSGGTNHPQYALAVAHTTAPTASSVRIFTGDTGGANSFGRPAGGEYISVAIFR